MTDSITRAIMLEAADKLPFCVDADAEVHTVTLTINGQHGKVDMIVGYFNGEDEHQETFRVG